MYIEGLKSKCPCPFFFKSRIDILTMSFQQVFRESHIYHLNCLQRAPSYVAEINFLPLKPNTCTIHLYR